MRWICKEISSPFEIKVAASQNENSRHAVDLGMDVGEPDLRLSTRVNGIYHIFYLELKKTKGKLSPDQIKWNNRFDVWFASYNAKRDVAYGLVEAKEKIISWVESLEALSASVV